MAACASCVMDPSPVVADFPSLRLTVSEFIPSRFARLSSVATTPNAVVRHLVALTTYLGHALITDTDWYLQAPPS
jgi:hypothetical protein